MENLDKVFVTPIATKNENTVVLTKFGSNGSWK